ncbi:cupin domain-containing protein [Rhodococcus wratislaviensis]|uniref:cupin domain-containing protein n=1 Tax=Rhodococcus wratislaviensis TaxID=44752 RepID=UPI003668FACA
MQRFQLGSHQIDNQLTSVAYPSSKCHCNSRPGRRTRHPVSWVPAERVGIYYLEYGADVRIDPYDLDDIYLVQVQLECRGVLSIGSGTFVSTPECGAVLQPGRRATLKLDRTNRQLNLRLDQTSIEQVLCKRLGREPAAPIHFVPQMDLTTSGSTSFRGAP